MLVGQTVFHSSTTQLKIEVILHPAGYAKQFSTVSVIMGLTLKTHRNISQMSFCTRTENNLHKLYLCTSCTYSNNWWCYSEDEGDEEDEDEEENDDDDDEVNIDIHWSFTDVLYCPAHRQTPWSQKAQDELHHVTCDISAHCGKPRSGYSTFKLGKKFSTG